MPKKIVYKSLERYYLFVFELYVNIVMYEEKASNSLKRLMHNVHNICVKVLEKVSEM